MTYTLVSAPALGFDLARLPDGARVAAVLRTAAAADASALTALAGRHPGRRRDSWRGLGEEGAGESLSSVLPDVPADLDDPEASGVLLRRLETGLLGDLAALDRLVRHELLEHTWLRGGSVAVQDPVASTAADVLVDAASAAYVGDAVAASVRRAMTAPFLAARLAVRDASVPVGVPEVDAMLDRLAGTDRRGRTVWRSVVERRRVGTAAWAPAMHQATWALMLSQRLHLAFDAQMAAVAAFEAAGLTARDAAYGVWNAVSGGLQAVLVADLLPVRDVDVLLGPWREADPV